jgi:hypothetical protein
MASHQWPRGTASEEGRCGATAEKKIAISASRAPFFQTEALGQPLFPHQFIHLVDLMVVLVSRPN